MSVKQSILRQEKAKRKHIGEINIHNLSNMKMTIINYRRFTDMDVKFDDGYIATHVAYDSFSKGKVKHPNYRGTEPRTDRLSESRIMRDGRKATIISYRSSNDIDIQYEDGTVLEHILYSNFVRGLVKQIDPKANPRVGETKISNAGQHMTIIEFYNFGYIYVKFEDGTIVKSTYDSFKKGITINKNYKHAQTIGAEKLIKQRIGCSTFNQHGNKLTVIAYKNSKNIVVKLELPEKTVILKDVNWSNFISKTISLKRNSNKILTTNSKLSNIGLKRIGESRISRTDLLMTIIDYNNYKDITVLFENGDIVKHKSYHDFTTGHISSKNATNIFE